MLTIWQFRSRVHHGASFLFIAAVLILVTLTGCGPSAEELEAVYYAPLPGDDWPVSTPAEQGLDPKLVSELYHNAANGEHQPGE